MALARADLPSGHGPLVCQIKRTVWTGNNGFVIALAKTEHGTVTLKGSLSEVPVGQWIEVQGSTQSHPKFGDSLMVRSYRPVMPGTGHGETSDGTARFLVSRIPGVGKKTAEKILEIGLDLFMEQPELIGDYVRAKSRDQAVEAWRRESEMVQLGAVLQSIGLGARRQTSLIQACGGIERAWQRLRSDPWSLASEVAGVSFRTLDAVAQRLGVPKNSPARIRAGAAFCANELSTRTGNTIHAYTRLLDEASATLGVPRNEVADIIPTAPDLLERIGSYYIGAANLINAEEAVMYGATELASLTGVRIPAHIVEAVADERRLDDDQRAALHLMNEKAIVALIGGPGTGKTTVVGAFVEATRRACKQITLAAPTGKAARRLSMVSKHHASTLHRALAEMEDDTASARDIVLVDECSMLSSLMMGRTMRSVRAVSDVLILVGDPDQLPPIEAGSPFRDLLDAKAIPIARLRHIHRQAGASVIPVVAKCLREGHSPADDRDLRTQPRQIGPGAWVTSESEGFRLIECDAPDIVERETLLEALRQQSSFGFNDSVVLAPLKKEEAGVWRLCDRLQRELNPNPPKVMQGREADGKTPRWCVGDPVLSIGNDYNVEPPLMHATLGRIVEMKNVGPPREWSLTIDWEDERTLTHQVPEGHSGRLALGYALTYHRSQGSEYGGVVAALKMHTHGVASREAVYTAVTRAKRECVLIIERGALTDPRHGALRHRAGQRDTALRLMLERRW